jgi:hypothetical protein
VSIGTGNNAKYIMATQKITRGTNNGVCTVRLIENFIAGRATTT